MFPTMDRKETGTNNPVVVIQPSQDTNKMSSTKKYVIIGVISIILLGLVLTGILVGMQIFTRAQKDLVEFTMNLNDGRKQDVISDVTNNVVKYHVKDDDQESWILSDFNKDIKVTKILKNGLSNCYVAPLNRSDAEKPSEVSKPDQSDAIIKPSGYRAVTYQVAEDPITDISFLSKDARDMCKGVSTYWLYPSCGNANSENPLNKTMTPDKRQQRYCYLYEYVLYRGCYLKCACGCYTRICARDVAVTCTYYTNGVKRCVFNYRKCFNGYYYKGLCSYN